MGKREGMMVVGKKYVEERGRKGGGGGGQLKTSEGNGFGNLGTRRLSFGGGW